MVLTLCLAVIAALFASVGQAGAPGYVAVMGMFGYGPAAIKATAEYFPKKDRDYATSIFNSGANVGAIAAPAIVPWVALTWGWQAAFIAAGAAGFLWLALWIPFFSLPRKSTHLSADELAHIDEHAVEGGVNLWSKVDSA